MDSIRNQALDPHYKNMCSYSGKCRNNHNALCLFSARNFCSSIVRNFVIWLEFVATCQGYSHREIPAHQVNVHKEVPQCSSNELVILLCVMHLYFCFVSDLLCVRKLPCVLESSDLQCYSDVTCLNL